MVGEDCESGWRWLEVKATSVLDVRGWVWDDGVGGGRGGGGASPVSLGLGHHFAQCVKGLLSSHRVPRSLFAPLLAGWQWVALGGSGQGGRGEFEVGTFPQFPAISQFFAVFHSFPHFPPFFPQLLLACPPCVVVGALCLLAQLLQNNKLQCFPAPEMIEWFFPVPQGHAAMWV